VPYHTKKPAKKRAPAKKAGVRGNGKKKKKTVAHGTRTRSR
jgi:hypothetical protein